MAAVTVQAVKLTLPDGLFTVTVTYDDTTSLLSSVDAVNTSPTTPVNVEVDAGTKSVTTVFPANKTFSADVSKRRLDVNTTGIAARV